MTYTVEINFNGFIGCSETYEVEAESEAEAEELAVQQAKEDLEVYDIERSE